MDNNNKKKNAVKILRAIGGRCPDCDSKTLVLICEKKIVNDILRSVNYIFCKTCEYKEPHKTRNDKKKLEFEET